MVEDADEPAVSRSLDGECWFVAKPVEVLVELVGLVRGPDVAGPKFGPGLLWRRCKLQTIGVFSFAKANIIVFHLIRCFIDSWHRLSVSFSIDFSASVSYGCGFDLSVGRSDSLGVGFGISFSAALRLVLDLAHFALLLLLLLLLLLWLLLLVLLLLLLLLRQDLVLGLRLLLVLLLQWLF